MIEEKAIRILVATGSAACCSDQERHDRGADAHHDDRIGQGAAHLGDKFGLALAVLGQAIEHDLEGGGMLAGAHHPDVEVGESIAMSSQSVGQRRSFAHALAHLR